MVLKWNQENIWGAQWYVKWNQENVFREGNGTLNEIKKSLSNDGTNELIQFLEEDSGKQAKRDNMARTWWVK